MILVLLLMSSAVPPRSDFQLMIGSAFQQFSRIADSSCPSKTLRYLKPAELDYDEERFEAQLPFQARMRLTALDAGLGPCGGGGLSCPAQRRLAEMAKLHLLSSFTGFACSQDKPHSLSKHRKAE